MEIQIPESVISIIKTIRSNNFEVYIVGGAVRDALINRPIYDWDLATNSSPNEITALFEDSYYDNDYGTVGVPTEDIDIKPIEITTFRTEHGYSDARRPDSVTWGKTLLDDLNRRDFTINALAFNVTDDSLNKYQKGQSISVEIIDHFDGKSDLQNKLIRAVGNADERFSEDALRMMRAVRIASELNFKIEVSTINAIKKSATSIHKIAYERVRDELLKLIASPHATNGIQLFKDVGLMNEILPELEKTIGVEQKSPNRHHIHDVWTHSVLSLKYCTSTDRIVRFATLIHDIGKPAVRKVMPNGVVTFYNHEIVGGKIAKTIAKRLRLSNKDSEKLYKLVRYHQFSVDERQTDSAIRRFIKKVGTDLITDMIDLRIGDRLGGGASETSWRLEEFKARLIEVQKQPFTVQDIKITGHDVMQELKISPSPKVGEILKDLYHQVVNNKLNNNREDLIKELEKYA